jgi:hypothetical protein
VPYCEIQEQGASVLWTKKPVDEPPRARTVAIPVRKIDMESEKVLIQQARWILERLEAVNQGLMSRAVSLVGFAGIELSLVGQMIINLRKSVATKKWSLNSQLVLFGVESITVLALLLCIAFLFLSLRARKEPFIPGTEDISQRMEDVNSQELTEDQQMFLLRSFPLHQLLGQGHGGLSYGQYLALENRYKGRYFTSGFNTLVIAQAGLGTLVLLAFWR